MIETAAMDQVRVMDRDRACRNGDCNGRSFECRVDVHLPADDGARRRGPRLMIDVRLVRTGNQRHGSVGFVCVIDCYPDGNHAIRAVHGWPVTARPDIRERDRERERQRQRDRETDRQTDRQTERQRQRDRETIS